jgi:hypothetical protein
MLQTRPIQPTSPTSGKLLPVEQDLFNELGTNRSSNVVIDGIEYDAISNPNEDLTVRLVGGGGTAGTVNDEAEPDRDVADIPKDPSMKKDGHSKNNEKRKSGMSGLRKLGHMGGLRKTDSSSSLKDML